MADNTPENLKSVEERDREWLENVYRGDKEKDLTPRAVLAGMVFGGLMSLSNLYVGLKSGWGLGVDIAAVIVIFAVSANLMTAGVTAGAACSCSDTIGNLKVGHMVGASPRKQFIDRKSVV